MPDLVTHSVVAFTVGRISGFNSLTLIVVLGTLIPDLATRTFTFFLKGQVFWLFHPLHTPLILVVLSYGISFLFPERGRKRIFLALLLGVTVHLILDSLQKHYGAGYIWLFPFSWKSVEFGLIWPENFVYVSPIMILLFFAVLLYEKSHSQKN